MAAQHVWPILITASSSDPDLTSKVFIYNRDNNLYNDDVFISVADVVELGLVGEDQPFAGDTLYRTNTIKFSCRSEDERTSIIAEMNDLIEEFNKNWTALSSANQETYSASGD